MFQLDVLKKLCRIDLAPEEEASLQKDLSRTLDYISKLNEVDTTNVPPCRFVLRAMLKRRLREDVATEILPREAFLQNAPDQIGGMIRTPPVLK